VPPAELPALTKQAWLGLNLLENLGLSYYYSLANKAFDYIQAGLPSVQMDFPEYRALQEEFGVFCLLKTLSPDSLTLAIQQLMEHPEQYNSLQENCLEAAKVLCWEKEEKQLLALFENAIRTPE
jgi:glycosyltransferase involved in cell wall biosynthesis